MSNDVVLVTGGSSGIGAAICDQLADKGYQVINLSRRGAQNDKVISVEVDLTDLKATREAVQSLTQRYAITNFVHNAGVILQKPLEEVEPSDLDTVANLHLGAAITITQELLPAMKSAHFGRIVLMSTRAIVGLAKRTVYSASKAGMIGMGRTWALELAPHGITVNMVAPGPIADTEMFHDLVPKESEQMQRVGQSVPVGRVGRPSDVANATLFFLEPNAGFVTGQTLFVCGGTSVGSITFQ
ncbi:MAG: SDR family oxidoreductase [Pseudomonadota bacterium]